MAPDWTLSDRWRHRMVGWAFEMMIGWARHTA
jgi:hypothetical protein